MESNMKADHFILFEGLNTVSENEIDKGYPVVQIVSPLDKNSNLSNKTLKINNGDTRVLEEKRKHPFSITLNLDLIIYGFIAVGSLL